MRGMYLTPPTLNIPAGAHKNSMRPFAGEKVHWTFSFPASPP
jgi:hypothetical protein